ncbi:MAG: T9SS type A sorting domain-containing protein [Puia sp.]|nr:T9SS type A sorting domain-containing protein [Puia sp.]
MKRILHPGPGFVMLLILQFGVLYNGFSQTCNGFTATCTATESRCTATGSIKIIPSGGSGTYNYQVQGPTNTGFTSSSVIDGLQSGTYTVTVKDIVSNCTLQINNVVVPGTYSQPRFGLTETDVTCVNGSNGSISVTGLQNGLSPFTFTLVAPSPMGVGTSNSTGTFTGLTPGTYAVQMTDSCGAIQTRTISIQNYSWSINTTTVTLANCTSYNMQIALKDSKGNSNLSGTAFSGFLYGVVTAPGDTTWFTTASFTYDIGQNRSLSLVAKDACGLVKTASWTNTAVPYISSTIVSSALGCTGFTASVYSPLNLSNPNYCLADLSGNPVPGQPCNSTGVFTNIPYGSYCIKLTNSCYDTVITRCFIVNRPVPAITGSVSLTNYTCTTVQATVTGQQNVSSPTYCLFTSAGVQVGACNTTGVFTAIPYGSYTIKMTDGCTGTVVPVNFTAAAKVPSVAANITTAGNTCTSFNASVTGATNLNTPQYCLVDNNGNTLSCNSTGSFTNLSYGTSYCIDVTDACMDTTIQRCFNYNRPSPTTGVATISNKTCSGFTVTINGQANIYSGGLYCLTDASGNPVAGVSCNATGVFTNVPYGSYCAKTTDYCTGNTLNTCFTVAPPVPSVGTVAISNTTCAGFTATQGGQTNLFSPTFCLYDSLNNQVGTCNGTGIFNITSFGSYTLKTTDGCTGIQFTNHFSVAKPVPSEASTVTIANQTCTTFSASITGQTNLTGAKYYLTDNLGNPIANNTTGIFTGIAYGSYCINTTTACLDTTIRRCFTSSFPSTVVALTATPSCSYNTTNVTVQISSGISPFNVQIYDTLNNLIKDTVTTSTNIVVSGLPSLISAKRYKITVSSACGSPVTTYVTATPSVLNHTITVTPQCPSGVSSGSANLQVVASTNLSGGVLLSITQMNFLPVTIGYSFSSGNTYTFSNMAAGTYVVTYTFPGCTASINDTVSVPVYSFPNLSNSAAYQCDNNSFSVGASVTGGAPPYTYQVIGSTPSMPAISSTSQSNPVFSINNGVQYSLVRLRAVDACGNAALADVNILPLANTIVTSTSDCLYQGASLSVPIVANATYTWYQKAKATSTDSAIVGTGNTYTIPYVTVSDTGIYVNRMSVNSGCLTKLSYFDLDGSCGGLIILPVDITLKGNTVSGGVNQLSWTVPGGAPFTGFTVQRSTQAVSGFAAIGTVAANPSSTDEPYTYSDNDPAGGANYYRLEIQHADDKVTYSNIVVLKGNAGWQVSVYPNPITDLLNINIRGERSQDYAISLYNITGQTLYTSVQSNIQSSTIIYHRNPGIAPGWYFLRVNNLTTGESSAYKVKFD